MGKIPASVFIDDEMIQFDLDRPTQNIKMAGAA
jgi:hypothetical protein